MKKRILKICAVLCVAFILMGALSSCATTPKKPDAKSASGTVEGTNISWSYDEDTYKLTITGSGEIPDSESSDKVWWKAVRHSVKEVSVSDGITAIGNYAFYYMPSLKEADIPDSVTRIGDLAFAFCTSLGAVELPEFLVTLGNYCFENCTSLAGIFVPSSVIQIGEGAFAYCSALKDVIVMAQITSVNAYTFKNCSKIGFLGFSSAAKNITVADTAFVNASKTFADAEFTESLEGKGKLTVKYVYEDGSEAKPSVVKELEFGDSYSVPSPVIDGYEASALTVSGNMTSLNVEEKVTYKSTAAKETDTETDAPATGGEDGDKKVNAGTVIAIVIFVLAVAVIVVLTVIMMRSGKNKNGTTVRKSPKDKK